MGKVTRALFPPDFFTSGKYETEMTNEQLDAAQEYIVAVLESRRLRKSIESDVGPGFEFHRFQPKTDKQKQWLEDLFDEYAKMRKIEETGFAWRYAEHVVKILVKAKRL
jgi:hypothetical protein